MKKSYGEKLADPRWQKRRLEVMAAAGFACEECGNKDETLNVHHKLYIRGREPWSYEDEYLSCLCDTHHKAWHDMEKALKELIATTPGLLNAVVAYARGYTRKVEAVKVPRKFEARKVQQEVGLAVDTDYRYSHLPKIERIEAAEKDEAEELRRSNLSPNELEAEGKITRENFFSKMQEMLGD